MSTNSGHKIQDQTRQLKDKVKTWHPRPGVVSLPPLGDRYIPIYTLRNDSWWDTQMDKMREEGGHP